VRVYIYIYLWKASSRARRRRKPIFPMKYYVRRVCRVYIYVCVCVLVRGEQTRATRSRCRPPRVQRAFFLPLSLFLSRNNTFLFFTAPFIFFFCRNRSRSFPHFRSRPNTLYVILPRPAAC